MTEDLKQHLEDFQELNMRNYNHDEVDELNQWAIKAYDLLTRQPTGLVESCLHADVGYPICPYCKKGQPSVVLPKRKECSAHKNNENAYFAYLAKDQECDGCKMNKSWNNALDAIKKLNPQINFGEE